RCASCTRSTTRPSPPRACSPRSSRITRQKPTRSVSPGSCVVTSATVRFSDSTLLGVGCPLLRLLPGSPGVETFIVLLAGEQVVDRRELAGRGSSLPGRLHGGCATDGDVAEGAVGPNLDRVPARVRALGGVQFVLHPAEAGVEIQPGGDPFADSHIHLA